MNDAKQILTIADQVHHRGFPGIISSKKMNKKETEDPIKGSKVRPDLSYSITSSDGRITSGKAPVHGNNS